MWHFVRSVFCALLICLLAATLCAPYVFAGERLVVGFFPNITHAHALVAQNMAAKGKGWFEERMPGVRIEWRAFNAGPSATEALLAKAIDLSYVGPSPALNAFVRSKGKALCVLSGAVRGGAGLVVRPQNPLPVKARDFIGKRIATPQVGNTQDIACRAWLKEAGLQVSLSGGDVRVMPTANADMVQFMQQGTIDAAWTVEPWISRLELEAGAKLVYAEAQQTSISTILVASKTIFDEQTELVRRFVLAHRELTAWIRNNPAEARQHVLEALARHTKRPFPAAVAQRAWPRLFFDNSIAREDFDRFFRAAADAGFLQGSMPEGIVCAP